MIARIVEITKERRHLSKYRGFLVVSDSKNNELARIALDDILTLLITGRGSTHSTNLFIALSERNVPVVFCNKNFAPVSWLLTLSGHHFQSRRMYHQTQAKLPVRKRIWRELVIAKLKHQAKVLEYCDRDNKYLFALASKVGSGDSANLEAQGARYYWSELFPFRFARDRQKDGINSLLNYGYTIVRACVARAVTSAGLHPSLGIHHKGPSNPMCLVDDLIEPYRPIVDYLTWKLAEDKEDIKLTKEIKAQLCKLALIDSKGELGSTPIFTSCVKLASSLVKNYMGDADSLEIFDLDDNIFYELDDIVFSNT